MTTVTPVTIATPDGVERQVRFTLGARRRLQARFGNDAIPAILQEHGDGALAEVLYLCLYDAKGKPPADLDKDELAENLAGDAGREILAAIIAAASQGRTTKNEAEAMLEKAADLSAGRIGSASGASAGIASDSPTGTSGTDSSSAKSTLSSSDTATASEPATAEPA